MHDLRVCYGQVEAVKHGQLHQRRDVVADFALLAGTDVAAEKAKLRRAAAQ